MLQAVRAGCEGRMQAYGFPWPPMLDCDKFPLDNDMCITAQSVRSASDNMEVDSREQGSNKQTQHNKGWIFSCSQTENEIFFGTQCYTTS